MKKLIIQTALCCAAIVLIISPSLSAQENGIDPEALIERILAVDAEQKSKLRDVVFDAELVEGEMTDEGFKEESRFVKKVYVKYQADTALFFEEYLEYYEKGELKSDKDCQKAGKERTEKKEKRKSYDISYPMLKPFYPESRELFEIKFEGTADEPIEGRTCYHFKVTTIKPDRSLLNGNYYFDYETFNLVRLDFTPSKLAGNLMFKMKKLDMSLSFSPTADDLWLPELFEIAGKGKISFLFGVSFAGRESYRPVTINGGLADELFTEVVDE